MAEELKEGWLSLEEGAKRLGVSRLRLREGIAAGAIRAQRDNLGFWRIILDGSPSAIGSRLRDVRVDPAELIGLLFDEVEEANASLSERDAHVDRLTALLVRHEMLLDRALTLAESRAPGGGEVERLGGLARRSDALIERTIETLEKKQSDLARMTGLVDRALETAATLDAEVSRQSELARKHHALLERLFALAQASVERMSGGGGPGGLLSRIRSRLAGEKGASR